MKELKSKSPGKLILSGEHAVVYGMPAISIAINYFATTTITSRSGSNISFNLKNFHHNLPDKLIQFIVDNFFGCFNLKNKNGLHIKIDSDILVGCGMGSSAAVALSIISALAKHFEIELTKDEYFDLAQMSEKLQHGRPSGVDAYTCLHGGGVYFQQGAIRSCPINEKLPIFMVNTGKPSVSTGECVAEVAGKFSDSQIWCKFAEVTNALADLLVTDNVSEIKKLIRANHHLLVEIGVVPQKTQKFIAEIEQANAAAKICGAGSIVGDNAGVVLVVVDEIIAIKNICERYNFDLVPVKIETRGLRVV
ncbi:MAG: mevalonate kinase [Gammaproteobacteria bacterium]|jgi:mevalonate kinase